MTYSGPHEFTVTGAVKSRSTYVLRMPLSHEAVLQAGAATEEVTPDGPVEMSGYGAREGPSTGLHDRLSASALVIEDGAVTVGLVSVDALNVSRELVRRVRRTLAANGTSLDELLVAATHTHAGPYLPARVLDVSPPLQADTDVSATVAFVEERLVAALTAAYERREPASVRISRAQEPTVPENRRAAGGVGGNVRAPSGPIGPIDPEVTVLLIETTSGKRAVCYNFACHPVCTTADETLLSADWPGYARRRIREAYGDVPVLFLNGAAGDINPSGMDPDRSGDEVYDYMADVGTRVGDAVVGALEDAESTDTAAMRRTPIRLDSADLDLRVKSTPPTDVIRERIAELDARLDRIEEERSGESEAGDAAGNEPLADEVAVRKLAADRQYAAELLAIAEWDATSMPTRLPYVKLGELGLLGMPGEVFARHGIELKSRARVSTLVPAGYVNGYVGYVPTLDELERVGYEVRTTKIAPEAIVNIRDAALELVT
jgi:neutral ceramidase